MARQTRWSWRRAVCAAAGALLGAWFGWGLAGCGDDDGGTVPPPPVGTIVGPAGGTAASDDGNAAVIIPAGALAANTTVTIVAAASPPAGALAGTVYELGPDEVALALPASLRIAYDPAAVPAGVAERTLGLGRLSGTTWLGLAGATVDTLADQVTGSLSHFSTYGVLPPGGNSEVDSLTVFVVDSPAPGSDDQFPTLTAALDWLGAHLDAEDLGIVVLRTDAMQTIESLALAFDLRLRVESGFAPAIAGPGATPLVVDAAGAYDLAGLRIVNAGGLVINANRRLVVTGCDLPATEVNIGGVKNAPFPAGDPGFAAKRGAADRAGGASLAGNTFGGDFTYRLQTDVETTTAYAIDGNTAAGVAVGGIGTLRADAGLELLDNAFGFIDADLKLDGQASLSIQDHTSLTDLSLAGEAVGGNPTVTLAGNVAADLQLSLKGLGKITINASANDITTGNVELSIKDYEFLGVNQTYVDLAILVGSAIADPEILWRELDATFDGLTFNALETPAGKVTLGLERVDFNGDVAVNSKAELKLQLTDAVSFHAAAEIRVESNLLDLQQTHVTYTGRATFAAQGASAGVTIASTGGEFRDHTQIIAPPAVGIAVTIDGTAFTQGGLFYLGPAEKSTAELDAMAHRGPAAVLAAITASVAQPLSRAHRTVVAPARGSRFESYLRLNDVTFEREGAAHIAIERTDCSVTVEDCPLLATETAGAVLAIEAVTGAVAVLNNTFRGGGVGALGCAQAVSIVGNTLEVTNDQSIACGVSECGQVTITDNVVTCGTGTSGGAVFSNPGGLVTLSGNTLAATSAALVVAMGRVNADNNPLLAGSILIGLGTLHLANNTLTLGGDVGIVDPYGGLLNDPVANEGFVPEACYTVVDFDGNGCCDYPPDANVIEDGRCHCDGIPPQGGL